MRLQLISILCVVLNPLLTAAAADSCRPQSEAPLLPVRIGQKYGFIDRTGRLAIKPQFESVQHFSEGRAFVWFGDTRHAYIDETGNVVAKTGYMFADEDTNFHEGLAPSCTDDDMCGYIDRDGNVVIPRQFKAADVPSNALHRFSEGLAAVEVDGKLGYIDKAGKWIIEPQFHSAEPFFEGLAAVEVDGKYGFIDRRGKFIIRPQYDLATRFSEGLARVNVGWNQKALNSQDPGWNQGKWGFINRKGTFTIQATYDWVDDFRCGVAMVRTVDKKVAMVNRAGNVVVQPGDKRAGYFSDGLLPVKDENGRFGYVNPEGQLVIQPQFTSADQYIRGLARVTIRQVEAYIDTTGRYVWKFPSEQYVPEHGESEVRAWSVGHVEVHLELTNLWDQDVILPKCGEASYEVQLCDQFLAFEQLTDKGWVQVQEKPNCCGVRGYPIYKRMTINPGSHVYATFSFDPRGLLIDNKKPLRLRVFVYEWKDDGMIVPTPLLNRKTHAVFSEEFELPKPPEW